MPRTRIELDDRLRELLGSNNVYYQPPESIKLKYPCIIYSRDEIDTRRADDGVYHAINRYEVTIIAKDPDFPLFDTFLFKFPMCSLARTFTIDNLNHYSFTLYY